MASISEDSGEETPLQVCSCCDAKFYFARVYELTCLHCSGAGSFEWCCYFHWNGWTYCCPCSFGCTFGQVRLIFILVYYNWLFGLWTSICITLFSFRYFTGHTYNPDGSVQYVKGKMGVGQTIRGVVRIFTVAVGIGFSGYICCFGVYSLSHHLEV